MDRKPDFETEGFRAWIPNEEETEKELGKDAIEVDIGNDTTIKLVGFHKVMKEGTDELVFAFKVKDDGNLLYYKPETTDEELQKEIERAFQELKQALPFLNFTDMVERAKEIYTSESRTLEKIEALKKEGKLNDLEERNDTKESKAKSKAKGKKAV